MKQILLQKSRFEYLKEYWEKELLLYSNELVATASPENNVMIVELSKLNTDFAEKVLKDYLGRCKIKYALAFF